MAEIQNIQQNIPEIVIDDGSVKVPIRNKQGDEIGVFYFRPTDFGFIDRYNETVGKLDQITEPLQNININPDGTADEQNETGVAAMKEAEKRLYEACDYMFGGNMSEAFFGKMHPFSPVNGAFYCENVLESVGRFMSAQFDRETAKIQKRMSKYTKGYTGKARK